MPDDRATLRVLILGDRLGRPSGVGDGGTTYYLTTLPALARAGLELTACFMGAPHPAARSLQAHGVAPVFLGRRRADPRTLADVLSLMRRRPPQVLHLIGWKSHFLGRLAAWRARRPAIVHFHESIAPPAWQLALQRAVAARTGHALAVSTALAEWAAPAYRLPREAITTLHNGIVLERYRSPPAGARTRLRAALAIAADAKVFGTVGRLAPMKGHDHAIRALPTVLEAVPGAVLMICGEGELREDLARLAADLGVAGAVRFAGFHPDFVELLAALDVVAMPSTFGEGMPFAAIEALATGTPVVAYPTMGIPDVVLHERTGLLVPPRDQRALALAVVRLLQDPALHARLGAGGRAHAGNFAIERHVEGLVALYRSLAGGAPSAGGAR